MSERRQNNAAFYVVLAGALQKPPAQFGSNLFIYDNTPRIRDAEGRFTEHYFKLTDDLSMWLTEPVRDEQKRRQALRDGRAWLTLQEGDERLSDSDRYLKGPEYSIVRLGGLEGGPGSYLVNAARALGGSDISLETPVVHQSHTAEADARIVPDPLEVPFLNAVYSHLLRYHW